MRIIYWDRVTTLPPLLQTFPWNWRSVFSVASRSILLVMFFHTCKWDLKSNETRSLAETRIPKTLMNHTRWCPSSLATLVNITPINVGFMVEISSSWIFFWCFSSTYIAITEGSNFFHQPCTQQTHITCASSEGFRTTCRSASFPRLDVGIGMARRRDLERSVAFHREFFMPFRLVNRVWFMAFCYPTRGVFFMPECIMAKRVDISDPKTTMWCGRLPS